MLSKTFILITSVLLSTRTSSLIEYIQILFSVLTMPISGLLNEIFGKQYNHLKCFIINFIKIKKHTLTHIYQAHEWSLSIVKKEPKAMLDLWVNKSHNS